MSKPETSIPTIHGSNPELLLEKILRGKIYDNPYWKEHCYALTASTIVDKAMQLSEVGGTFGGARKPTHFICLALKMLQIAPEKEIVLEFIRNKDFKYVTALGVFYMRSANADSAVVLSVSN
jgi:pre-mRNA-splicing factor 38A